ncbi:MAG: alpha/beta hydrolase [Bacteroidetes bacterium]|nr:alpha/beta hydrolase [Fibrella sp.]
MKIRINDTKLNVLEAGSRHSISPITFVFLHYFGGSARAWTAVMERVVARLGARCLAIDLRGFGDSDAPPSGYSVDAMADDVAAVIEHFGLAGHRITGTPDDNYILVGHSMSGKVALALAARRLAGMRSVVLLAPSPPSPEPIPDGSRQQMLQTHGQREAAEQTLREITAAPLPSAADEQIIADNLRSAAVAWDAWLTSGSREDITGRMAQIETPVYVAVGDQDAAVPLRVQQTAVLPWLPAGSSLQVIPGSGHLLPYEAPDAVVTILAAALAEEPL